MYAGHDGNVYKNTGSGWQSYNNGSWNNVQKPTQQSVQQAHPQGTTDYNNAKSSGGWGDVNQEAQNRAQGMPRLSTTINRSTPAMVEAMAGAATAAVVVGRVMAAPGDGAVVATTGAEAVAVSVAEVAEVSGADVEGSVYTLSHASALKGHGFSRAARRQRCGFSP